MAQPRQQLDTECKTYQEHKEELLKSSEGKYVLIKGNTIVGAFDTKLDAVAVGHQQFGCGPFMVKKIVEVEKPVRILLPGGWKWP